MKKTLLITMLLIPKMISAQEQEEAFHNPADGSTYVAPGGWKEYSPKSGQPNNGEKVYVKGVRLLNSQDDFAKWTTVDSLANYLKKIDAIALSIFSNSKKEGAVLVQFESTPNKTEIKISLQGELDHKMIQSFYTEAQSVSPLIVFKGKLKYQQEYAITP